MLRSRGLRALSRLRYSLLQQFVLIVSLLGLLMLYRSTGKHDPVSEILVQSDGTEPAAVDQETPGTIKLIQSQDTSAPVDVQATQQREICRDQPLVTVSETIGKGQTALVTGIAGFVGSHVARYCLDKLGLTVVGLDDLSSGKSANIPSGVEFYQGSFGDSKLLHRLFSSYRFDFVYHLAGHGGEAISHHVRSFTYENELVSSTKLLNAVLRASGTKTFVYLSSTSVYADSSGEGQTKIHAENSSYAPSSPLAIAKLAFEHDLQAAHRSYGLSFSILRAHNLYGPRQNLQDPYHSVVSSLVRQHLNQKRTQPVTIFGDGSQRRCFTYIDDVVPLIGTSPFVSAAENQVINIGSDELTSINDLKTMVGDALGRHRTANYVKSHIEHDSIQVDHTKMRCVFGYREMTSLTEGLSLLVPHVLATFSGRDDVQSALEVSHVKHVELAGGLPIQSWEGHEVDVVNSMVLSEKDGEHLEENAGADSWPNR